MILIAKMLYQKKGYFLPFYFGICKIVFFFPGDSPSHLVLPSLLKKEFVFLGFYSLIRVEVRAVNQIGTKIQRR
jgi:hypothetical protein